MKKDASISAAERVLDIESRAVRALKDRLDSNFSKAVNMALGVTGKVVVSGMGKSGIVGQKIASTSPTGTPAFFSTRPRASTATRMLMGNDLLIAISNWARQKSS